MIFLLAYLYFHYVIFLSMVMHMHIKFMKTFGNSFIYYQCGKILCLHSLATGLGLGLIYQCQCQPRRQTVKYYGMVVVDLDERTVSSLLSALTGMSSSLLDNSATNLLTVSQVADWITHGMDNLRTGKLADREFVKAKHCSQRVPIIGTVGYNHLAQFFFPNFVSNISPS